MDQPSRIHLSRPVVGDRERELLLDALDSGWIAPVGPHVDGFERDMVERLGGGHAVALSSGTAALHLALVVLGVGAGDEVWTATLTFAATANAITYVGARPVFVDCDPATWQLDPELIRDGLARRTRTGRPLPKAIISVDLYGQCADYRALQDVCDTYDIALIEDAAEALGATYEGRAAGTLGQVGVFSFNGNKIITTSGGGMLVSDDAELVDRARFLSTQAREPVVHYEHREVGFNYRLSNLLAAVGRAQLETLEDRVTRRREINAAYRAALEAVPGISFMPEADYGRANAWLTCLTIDPDAFGAFREDVRLALERANVESRPVWKPMHLQPAFRDCEVIRGEVAADLFERGLCLPSGSGLTKSDQSRVVDAVVLDRPGLGLDLSWGDGSDA